jgi:Putative prokaryotic signal transducing protein
VPTTIDAPPLPPSLEEERGGGGDWIELVKVPNDIEAHLLTGRLQESGVETRVVKDRSDPGAWLYGGSNPWAPVAILVHRLQIEDARIVLAEISLQGPEASQIKSPSSPEVRRRALAWWIAAILLGLIFTAIALMRTDAAMESCARNQTCGGDVDPHP